ncbi:hypothetical protein MTBBW1_1280007 [Desulfamplus magnetovallimortis]|uniref:LamG-like jellyroll fold domain-containing protein n=1 Tax=Desulfamplus magnetovallimortis TaxID=1246637 RepID=A0A1W1H6Y8_9BACT|nr:LamG-like jellyroll fold domain-containing protein [Desulfamplus magnetovallimortis]SLM28204.1 hypothetical protein MTBBW1_1280007 [Desulfamplus magnetovallimortis]
MFFIIIAAFLNPLIASGINAPSGIRIAEISSLLPEPTCTDGIQNQGETGVDCGGPCPNACSAGRVFYVANNGDDSFDGLSPEKAWRTINHVNSQTFEPGDAVLFRRGDTWRETVYISESGTQDAYITYGAYGSGAKPRILGSERAYGWVAESLASNVWRSENTLDIPMSPGYGSHPASLFFGEPDGSTTWGTMQSISYANTCGTNFSSLTDEYDWCWKDGYIYVYCEQNPSTRYSFIEVPQRDASIRMATSPPQEYIIVDGLELMYNIKAGYDDGWPMDYEVKGLVIKNCHIAYIGVRGAASAMGLQIWHSDMLVENNDIHDSGRRNISYNVYVDNGRHNHDLVFENVTFKNNTLHNGYHTNGFDISGGSSYNGVYFNDTFRNFSFIGNLIYDDPDDDPTNTPNDWTSMGIYLNSEAATFTDFKIFNNIISYPKQKGLIVSGVDNAQIYHNTIYGMNDRAGGSGYRSIVSISGSNENLEFYNNIVHGTVERGNYLCRNILISGSDTEVLGMDYNLYYQDDQTQRLFDNPYGSYNFDEWSQYQTETGWDTNSPSPANSMFSDPLGLDFSLLQGSPGIDAGFLIPGVNDGYEGSAPDIGAIESAIDEGGSGLILHMPFDGNANDISGNKHHGVVTGAATAEDRHGNVDSAYYFDGESYITVESDDSVVNVDSDGWSLSLWVKPDENQERSSVPLVSYGYGSAGGYSLAYWWEYGMFRTDFYAYSWDDISYVAQDELDDIIWYLHTITYDGKNLKQYVNGILVGETECEYHPTTPEGTYSLRFGADSKDVAYFFKGYMDDIRIYDRALTDVEIAQMSELEGAVRAVKLGAYSLADFEQNRLEPVKFSNFWAVWGNNGNAYSEVVENPVKSGFNTSDYVGVSHTFPSLPPPDSTDCDKSEYVLTAADGLVTDQHHIMRWKLLFTDDAIVEIEDIVWNWMSFNQIHPGVGKYPSPGQSGETDDTIAYGGGIFNDLKKADEDDPYVYNFRYRAVPDEEIVPFRINIGEWMSFTYEIFWTQSDNGFWRVWKDGELLASAYNVKTLPDSYDPAEDDFLHFKTGLYNKWDDPEIDSLSLYFDDIELYIGDNIQVEDVCPECM